MLRDISKLLISFIRKNKESDVVKATNDFLFNEIKTKKIDPIAHRYLIDKATREDLANAIWMFGHDLTEGSNYLDTDEYYKRQFLTLVRRILNKSTRKGYLYVFYIYLLKNSFVTTVDIVEGQNVLNIADFEDIDVGAKVYGKNIPVDSIVISKGNNGITINKPVIFTEISAKISFFNEGVYPLVETRLPLNSLVPFKGSSLLELTTSEPITLDMDDPFILDQNLDNLQQFNGNGDPIYNNGVKNDGKPTWYLDNTSVIGFTTRHFLINYGLDTVEGADYFRTPETLKAYYNDINLIKRKVEIPHFEPKLTIKAPLGVLPPSDLSNTNYIDILTNDIINVSGVSGTGKQTSVAYSFTLANVTHLQFGKGRRSDFSYESIKNDYNSTGQAVAIPFENDYSYFSEPNANKKFLDPNNYHLGYYELNSVNKSKFPLDYFIVEKKKGERIVVRNHLFPYHKWSSFSEVALFAGDELVMYSTFPTIAYISEMLSSCYLDMQIILELKEIPVKYVLPFEETDWIYDSISDRYYIKILKHMDTATYTFPDPQHNSGYLPMVYVYKDSAGHWEEVLIDEIKCSPDGNVTLFVTNDLRFKGRVILL